MMQDMNVINISACVSVLLHRGTGVYGWPVPQLVQLNPVF